MNMGEPARDTVSCCNECPFLYLSQGAQNMNRCTHPTSGDVGRKLFRPLIASPTQPEAIERGYTPEWCPLKTTPVLVEWRK